MCGGVTEDLGGRESVWWGKGLWEEEEEKKQEERGGRRGKRKQVRERGFG